RRPCRQPGGRRLGPRLRDPQGEAGARGGVPPGPRPHQVDRQDPSGSSAGPHHLSVMGPALRPPGKKHPRRWARKGLHGGAPVGTIRTLTVSASLAAGAYPLVVRPPLLRWGAPDEGGEQTDPRPPPVPGGTRG